MHYSSVAILPVLLIIQTLAFHVYQSENLEPISPDVVHLKEVHDTVLKEPIHPNNAGHVSPGNAAVHDAIILIIGKEVPKPGQLRQEDDDDDTTSNPASRVPAVLPGVTKIINGFLNGNINDIFHGSFSFAPKNVSENINTVYNTVVGLPQPKTKAPATEASASGGGGEEGGSGASGEDEDESNKARRSRQFYYNHLSNQ